MHLTVSTAARGVGAGPPSWVCVLLSPSSGMADALQTRWWVDSDSAETKACEVAVSAGWEEGRQESIAMFLSQKMWLTAAFYDLLYLHSEKKKKKSLQKQASKSN